MRKKLSIVFILALSFQVIGISTIQAQDVQDSAICFEYDTTDLQPIGIGNTVFPYTEKIGIWVQLQNPADTSYRILWYDPSGNPFRNVAVDVIEMSGEDWGIVFDSINIAESTAKNKLGVWTVQLSIEGQVEVESEFQIIDYAKIVEDVQTIQERITDISDEKDALAAQNAALEASIATLEAEYAALEAQVGTSSDYEELLEDYENLEEDYEALKASQGTTKMMMYAAMVVALVAVVVAVYFGFINK